MLLTTNATRFALYALPIVTLNVFCQRSLELETGRMSRSAAVHTGYHGFVCFLLPGWDQARRQGGGQGAEAPPRNKLNFRKNKPPSPLDSFQSQFIAVLQSTNFFNAKCRLKHPISRNFSAPLAPAKGLRPQTPATACSLRSLRSCFERVGSLRSPKAPPKEKTWLRAWVGY